MSDKTLMAFIKELNKSVFTTAELVAVSGKSASVVSQGLNFLQSQGLTFKVYHGIWGEGKTPPDPYSVIKYLFPKQRVYVSFTSALHLHSIIEQIPQTITLASVAHTRKIKTAAGVFFIHHIEPSFFFGFDWKSDELDFLLAEPEKAMADCLYISAHKKNQFSAFPELHFPKKFSFDKIESYLKKIKNENVVVYALKRLEKIKREHWKNKKKAI